ncbi:hypothetical protein ACTXG6_45815 [Pseudonocardia sp. Cha107L01]|uniref:hypothetical protein n=1 Tax=Pseudonocardia sp. Cha107L01 TaxID=3457576 RepID=UPI00403E912B
MTYIGGGIMVRSIKESIPTSVRPDAGGHLRLPDSLRAPTGPAYSAGESVADLARSFKLSRATAYRVIGSAA